MIWNIVSQSVIQVQNEKESPTTIPASASNPSIKPTEQKGLLQGWFPGLSGWSGESKSEENIAQMTAQQKVEDVHDLDVGEPPPKISRSELGNVRIQICKL